jgi:hypothetical protein
VRWTYTGAIDDDAVATLLLDDLITIDAEGMMTVTECGRDPHDSDGLSWPTRTV